MLFGANISLEVLAVSCNGLIPAKSALLAVVGYFLNQMYVMFPSLRK